jgi:hypothetical protein
VPATFVPRKFPATTLFDDRRRMALPEGGGERLMTSPRIVLPELPACRSKVLVAPPLASISMTGPRPAMDSGCVVLSRLMASVTSGRPDVSWMRYQLRAVPAG